MNMLLLVTSASLLIPIIFQLYTKYFIKRVLNLVRKFTKCEYELFLNIIFLLNFLNKMSIQTILYVENAIESSVGYAIFSVFFLLGLTGLINKERYEYNTRPIYLSFIFIFISFTLLSMVVNNSGSDRLIYYTLLGLSILFIFLYSSQLPIGDLRESGVELAQEIMEKSFVRDMIDIYFFNIDEVIYRKKLLYYFFHMLFFSGGTCAYFDAIHTINDIIYFIQYYVSILVISLILSLFMKKDFFRLYSIVFTGAILLMLNSLFINLLSHLFLDIFDMDQSLYSFTVEPFITGLLDIILAVYLTVNGYSYMTTYYIFYSVLLNLAVQPGIFGTFIFKNSFGFMSELSKLAIPFINISVLLIPLSLEASKQTLSFELGFTLIFTYVLYLSILFSQYYFYGEEIVA